MKLYEGLRVLDFTGNIAGPTIGQWLVEYGAEVIHIEKPVLGDDSRYFPPIVDGESAHYHTYNHGKKSVTIDMKDPRGKAMIEKLCSSADILLESSRPGVMDKLGFGYDTVHAWNPRLIYCSVSAFGQTGPYAGRPGYDIIAQGASGMMYYNGDKNTGPVRVATEIGDYSAAVAGFGAINAALYYRERTGEGQHLDISLTRVLTYMAAKFDYHRIFHKKAEKTGNHNAMLCPYGVFRCPDGENLIIACANNNLAFQFFRLIGREDLIQDERFNSNPARCEHSAEMMPIVEEWLDRMGTAKEAERALLEAGIPCSKVYDYEDVDNDPHYNACGWLVDIPMPESMKGLRSRRIVGSPFGFSAVQPEYHADSGFGGGNHEVLESLGYSAQEVDEIETEWAEAVKAAMKRK